MILFSSSFSSNYRLFFLVRVFFFRYLCETRVDLEGKREKKDLGM